MGFARCLGSSAENTESIGPARMIGSRQQGAAHAPSTLARPTTPTKPRTAPSLWSATHLTNPTPSFLAAPANASSRVASGIFFRRANSKYAASYTLNLRVRARRITSASSGDRSSRIGSTANRCKNACVAASVRRFRRSFTTRMFRISNHNSPGAAASSERINSSALSATA